MRLAARPLLALVLASTCLLAGCGPSSIDVAGTIKITNVVTGWFDAGIVNGQNKLVPSASFTVTNEGTARVSALQVFSVFRFVGESEELGSSMNVLHGDDALAPKGTSKPLTVRAIWGATGPQTRAEILASRYLKNAHVEVFAKYGAGQFIKVADLPVRRQLLTH